MLVDGCALGLSEVFAFSSPDFEAVPSVRYARKTDSTQADIVKGLREHYVRVWVIEEPCDLLCHYWDNRARGWRWQPLECKPLTGKRAPKARIRKDQAEQTAFLIENEVPVVTNIHEALEALGIHRQAGVALTA